MPLSYASTIIAEFEVKGLNAWPALDGLLLSLSTSYRTYGRSPENASPGNASLSQLRCSIGIGATAPAKIIAIGFPEYPVDILPQQIGGTHYLAFRFPISSTQINKIEQIRANSEMVFQIQIQGWASTTSDGYHATQDLRYDISQDSWLKILQEGGYSKSLLFEALQPEPIALSCGPVLDKAAHFYRTGDYENCVSNCRIALESLSKEINEGDSERSAEGKFSTMRKSMSKLEREYLLRAAAKHYTHLAHHTGSEGEIHLFGRSDAYLILTLTGALVARAAVRSQTT